MGLRQGGSSDLPVRHATGARPGCTARPGHAPRARRAVAPPPLPQAEEGQDGNNHDHKPDDVDDVVHGCRSLLSVGPAMPVRLPRVQRDRFGSSVCLRLPRRRAGLPLPGRGFVQGTGLHRRLAGRGRGQPGSGVQIACRRAIAAVRPRATPDMRGTSQAGCRRAAPHRPACRSVTSQHLPAGRWPGRRSHCMRCPMVVPEHHAAAGPLTRSCQVDADALG